MRLVHLECLRHWLESRKAHKQNGAVFSLFWKHLDCELCKASLPTAVSLRGKQIELIRVPEPKGPYLRLEMVEREKVQGKCVHLISFAERP